MRRLTLVAVAIAGVLAILLAAGPGMRYAHSAVLLARVGGPGGAWAARAARVLETPVSRQAVAVPSRRGMLRGRLYIPARARTRPILLTGGVHADGIDEPRLAGFARALAAHGTPVLTPELPDLVAYRITPDLADQIEDAARWLSDERLFGADEVGLAGISFAGGLSVVAAARPAVRDRVAFTLSFGGHGDLTRVFRYLCTGRQPDGTYLAPHDYGVAVLLLNLAAHVVPADQIRPLQEAVLTFLDASHAAMVDRSRARERFTEAARLQRALAEPARALVGHVVRRDVEALGARLLPFVDEIAMARALSPERSPAPSSPVHLLHGSQDIVVPAMESTLLADDLQARGGDVRVLLTPLITHAELNDRPGIRDTWNLVSFWASLEW